MHTAAAYVTTCMTFGGPTSSIASRRSSNWKAASLRFPEQSIALRKKGPSWHVTMMLISGRLAMSVHPSITMEQPFFTHVSLIFSFCIVILDTCLSKITVLNLCSPGGTYEGPDDAIAWTISL